ncbi:agamous-like MADS-box protein AGL62 [Cornus florida]|uniref:agamous-like MADS-box protein AGL62 n=1 Tax=Cornus florida TaxID=4283 RepID=UPI00289B4A53|nr:agamous-like MADS-box protein AGL62 [Cornus florida]
MFHSIHHKPPFAQPSLSLSLSDLTMARRSKGRQKVEMTRMSKESNLLVTFSKRRSGLFKKASELCILCGAEVAIVVFSPGKKVFSFGHPGVESIMDRFLTRNPPSSSSSTTSTTLQLVEAHRDASIRELNKQLTEVLNRLEAEKKHGEELSSVRKASRSKGWWEGPIEGLGPVELEQLKVAMEELKKDVAKQEKIKKEGLSGLPFLGGSSSNGGLLGGGALDAKVCGLGLSMTPHGYTLGYGHGFF